MALEMSSYKVYKKTFLSSVRWLFSYSANEEGFVERFVNEMTSLSFEKSVEESKAVMMKKPGITVLANAELVFINCAVDVYQGFEAVKTELKNILVALNKLGVQEIKNTTCVKENLYRVDKTKVRSTVTDSQFSEILFNSNFAANPFFAETRDNIQVIATRSFSDSITEAKMQLLITAGLAVELPLEVVAERLQEIDKASYDAWSFVVSEGLKRIMEG